MSDILCKWLNQELKLSKTLDPRNFAKDFSNGYLIGEILHKYQMQTDFNMFLKRDTSISKVNNFTRLEPTLKLLGISFDINTAQDLMQEKEGVAAHLLYQLYVSLEKRKKAEISRTMMEINQPPGRALLHKKEHEIFSYRLPQVVRRDSDMKLHKIAQQFEDKCQQVIDRSMETQPIQQKRPLKVHDKKRMESREKVLPQDHSDVTAKQTDVPKPSSCTLHFNIKQRQQQHKEREAQQVQTEIALFEEKKKKLVTFGFSCSSSIEQDCEGLGSEQKLILQSNSEYIREIRRRLKENEMTYEQRRKRVDRFLVEQFMALEAQQEVQREEQMVRRLTRQTKQEQRLAAQLMQIRRQKEVILENRLFREQQHQQRREKDFQEALDREAVLAQQAKLAREEDIKKELELSNRIAAERSLSRHKKHFEICKDILGQIVDLATKIGEYRQLTENLIPKKLMKEWKESFFRSLPLYEPRSQPEYELSTSQDPAELKKQKILNNLDYDEYSNMVGEWAWPKEATETKLPPSPSNILVHVVQRLEKIVYPPVIKSSSPSFAHTPIKACILGKFCSGKTTCLAKIAEALGICVLSTDTLIEEGLKSYKNEEELPTCATQGVTAEIDMRKENTIPDELLVDVMVKAISQIPAQSGWILDGFPYNITQAHLLEKALGGFVDEVNETVSKTTNLAADPEPPKPSPRPAPVLDLALLLDISDECVVRRAYSHGDTNAAATASQPSDLYVAQIQSRITTFQDACPELEKWFGENQNILARVSADVDEGELYSVVESILKQVIQKRHEALADPPVEDVVSDNPKPPETPLTRANLPTAFADEEPVFTESCSSLKEEKLQRHTGNVSPSSVSNEDNHEVSKDQSETPSSAPGSACQLFVDEPLPLETAEYLCSYWDMICESYVDNIKQVMEQLRSQLTAIDLDFFNIRERYKHYLGRPDLKQELVSPWQKEFNSIQDDMREDEDTKAELHLRLDELRERLWDIIDHRKEENEQERATLTSNGWLEAHTALLLNHHSILIQIELNRFWETLCLLRVYYWSMHMQEPLKPVSNFCHISLLKTPGNTDQDESKEAPSRRAQSQMDNRRDKKTKLRPDSTEATSKVAGHAQPEPEKPSHEKFVSDYEEALKAISTSVAAETQQRETKEQKEKEKEKTTDKKSASAKKAKKEKNSAQKQMGDDAEKTQAQTPSEMTHDQEIREKIHKEYTAALIHEEDATKVRIELVKDHGLVMVHSLETRAHEIFTNMEKRFQGRYLSEMKCIDQLSEVVRHVIETGAKLQDELVLEGCDFYLNGDCHLVASPTPPPRPPPFENPLRSTPTIAQLESLYHQLRNIAPSGLMSSFEFSALLEDTVSTSRGRNTLPQPWINMNETQLIEIVSLIMDEFELIDWRRFLLSAALPWPFPSLTQLLDVLQHFRTADADGTGYVNQEQYLQTELWFSSETVQNVPDDPSEPLPYSRLANLRKFFFQLFADHSMSPPRLDYVSMLQYFAADPNPRQGFIRALSLVLGQYLHQPPSSLLVKSMPSLEEASLDFNGDCLEEDSLFVSSCFFRDQEVSIPALLNVICHKVVKMKDNTPLPPGCLSQEEHTQHLVNVFRELEYSPEDSVPFSVLSKHPYTQMLIETSTQYQLVNIHNVLLG
ncbi:sperm flagellar protein 2 isoform X2 [Kryptolebias marmoratus]|uniref:sperm flagellar protein 2 isoform X2 n=1 Tax=Kryptolebias marmoratus TaxID=37003 RepID=UPI0007F8876D|nr:sperm flagellar protein 2 isoform X2 [Kryptolebias marmoratus]